MRGWTKHIDQYIRDTYFPGLDPAALACSIQDRFGGSGVTERSVMNRLSELKLRNKRKPFLLIPKPGSRHPVRGMP